MKNQAVLSALEAPRLYFLFFTVYPLLSVYHRLYVKRCVCTISQIVVRQSRAVRSRRRTFILVPPEKPIKSHMSLYMDFNVLYNCGCSALSDWRIYWHCVNSTHGQPLHSFLICIWIWLCGFERQDSSSRSAHSELQNTCKRSYFKPLPTLCGFSPGFPCVNTLPCWISSPPQPS